MSPRLRFPGPKHGFSLVELLVSLAVVGVLASILISVLGIVRSKSELTECVSNLRQIGMSIALYTQDSNGELPTAFKAPSQGVSGMSWRVDLYQSDILKHSHNSVNEGHAVFFCPTMLRESGKRNPGSYMSYGMNGLIGPNPAYGNGITHVQQAIQPEKTLLMADSNYWGYPNWAKPAVISGSNFIAAHDGFLNLMYLDYHVEIRSEDDPIPRSGIWGNHDKEVFWYGKHISP